MFQDRRPLCGRALPQTFILSVLTVWMAALGSLSSPSQATAGTAPTACFLRRDWTGAWRVTPDARTMYINVSGTIYRLDLEQSYPLLRSAWAVLHDRDSSDAICSAIDFRLSVSDRIGNWQAPIVRRMTRLTAEQAAALPQSLRP